MAKAKYTKLVPDFRLRNHIIGKMSTAIRRCHNPRDRGYKTYGAKGIQVYEPWRKNRVDFFKYLITLPGWDDTSLELDRKNSNKGYEPGNLQFISKPQNLQKKRRSRIVQLKSVIFATAG